VAWTGMACPGVVRSLGTMLVKLHNVGPHLRLPNIPRPKKRDAHHHGFPLHPWRTGGIHTAPEELLHSNSFHNFVGPWFEHLFFTQSFLTSIILDNNDIK
jgi:hypothetical protein